MAVGKNREHANINEPAKVGDEIIIVEMRDEPRYSGKTGVIKFIDDANQLHGTWGFCAIIPEADRYRIIKHAERKD